jgi:hypothetical protein
LPWISVRFQALSTSLSGFIRFLQRYSGEELQLLIRVLHDATEASFLTLGQQAVQEKRTDTDD